MIVVGQVHLDEKACVYFSNDFLVVTRLIYICTVLCLEPFDFLDIFLCAANNKAFKVNRLLFWYKFTFFCLFVKRVYKVILWFSKSLIAMNKVNC